jgi:outer membrane lipoprotein SlyB
MKRTIATLLALVMLTACAKPNQNTYGFQDVGQSTSVEFGTVISQREVEITGKNTGMGAIAGGSAGAIAGASMGQGNGSLAAALAGVIIGGIIASQAEQAMQDSQGVEYIITLKSGKTVTIVQYIGKDDKPIRNGARVMVQQNGQYQRVLPANDLPTKVKKPKAIKVED